MNKKKIFCGILVAQLSFNLFMGETIVRAEEINTNEEHQLLSDNEASDKVLDEVKDDISKENLEEDVIKEKADEEAGNDELVSAEEELVVWGEDSNYRWSNNKCKINDVTFKINKDKNIVCIYACKEKKSDELILPNKIKVNGRYYDVTIIDRCAFFGCRKLTSIKVPNSVVSIGYFAFTECDNLENIIIPDSVKNIDYQAFNDCRNLHDILVDKDNEYYCDEDGVLFNKEKTDLIRYPEGKTENYYDISNGIINIRSEAFYGSSLSNINIPSSVKSIGDGALGNNKKLESLVIKCNIDSIGKVAFSECCNLKNIVIPQGIKELGDNAFYGCYNLNSIWTSETVYEKFKDKFFESAKPILIESDLPNSEDVIKIKADSVKCFEKYSDGSKREVPLEIDDQGYFIHDPSRVKEGIRYYSYEAVKNGVTYESPETNVEVNYENILNWNEDNQCCIEGVKYQLNDDNSVSIVKNNTKLSGKLTLNSEITVGENQYVVNRIEENAFTNTDIESLTINGISEIDDWAFSGCKNLQSVDISDGVTSIGTGAFAVCESLKEVKLSEDLTKISGFAFNTCTSLEEIEIPESVDTIETFAFLNCENLKSIIISSNVEEVQSGTFINFNEKTLFYVKDGDMEEKLNNSGVDSRYIINTGWNKDNECVVNDIKYKKLSDNTASVVGYNNSLKGNINLNSEITVNEINYTVVSLGDNAFNKSNIESIVLPDTITTIGDWAFTECYSLKKLIIPDSVTSIGSGLCSLCDKLEEVRLSNSIDNIAPLSFNKCASLETIEIPESITKIDSYALMNCTNLKEIKILGSVEKFEDGSLYMLHDESVFITSSDITKNSLVRYGISEDKIVTE